ncbi:hypothetical protein M426DRAFT_9313 [Hypoxylon sp. CI-4A]|nr:hypothetical protein M426DRAFT_9313 [Hypoxylon sp. CI-4A]
MPLSPYRGLPRDFTWREVRREPSPKPKPQQRENVVLPSIRQAFPELLLSETQYDIPSRTQSCATTMSGRSSGGTTTPPEYIHSSILHKRRCPSPERDGIIGRSHSVPRQCNNSYDTTCRSTSPSSRRKVTLELRTGPIQAKSPPPPPSPPRMTTLSPVTLGHTEYGSFESRPSLPRLDTMDFVRDDRYEPQPVRRPGYDEYNHDMRRPSIVSNNSQGTEGGSPTYPHYSYGFHHRPNRVQSLSMGSTHPPFDRTPFSPPGMPSPSHFDPSYESMVRLRDYSMVMNNEGKQRKRRGNLPKETTDILRAWFLAHLNHPYPTEEEKQTLMRKTGLQLNQISNWFINARRRQLPTMINNARAESDAMTMRGETKLLPSTERADYDPESKPLSDGEGNGFSNDLESIKRRRTTNIDRGSI